MSEGDFVLQYIGGHFVQGGFCPGVFCPGGILSRGHYVLDSIPQQALHWQVPGFKRGPGRPRPNCRSIVNKDLSMMGLTWQEAEVAAL